ncbi:hypothetical protein M0802_008490 [Mischocyttarus mexicanus]|nr:hypothetical protein M0802_008490 [Mischocyttarus mexicanus]
MLPVKDSYFVSNLESKDLNDNKENQIKDEDKERYKYNGRPNHNLTVIPITNDILRKIQRELGLIKLCWPDKDIREDIYLSSLSNDYYCNLNDKEKLLLLYAENFRRQFHFKYNKRKPILLACENEFGVQKFVSVNIKRSTLAYPKLNNWLGCAEFVQDFIAYEPHNNVLLLGSNNNRLRNNSDFKKLFSTQNRPKVCLESTGHRVTTPLREEEEGGGEEGGGGGPPSPSVTTFTHGIIYY